MTATQSAMLSDLPIPVARKLEQALNQWQAWQGDGAPGRKPQAIAVLGEGLSNHSIRVADERDYVVRVDGPNTSINGLNRHTEWRVLQEAAAAGLAPTPRYFNPDIGVLVCDFLPGDSADAFDAPATAALLRHIHALPPVHFRLDINERVARYERHIKLRGDALHPVLAACLPAMRELPGRSLQPPAYVLCHNDLLRANRLQVNEKLFAIDWEYCAMGNAWFDLAVICAGDGLRASTQRELVEAYLGREARGEENGELNRQILIYRFIELLWANAIDEPSQRERLMDPLKLEQLHEGFRSLS